MTLTNILSESKYYKVKPFENKEALYIYIRLVKSIVKYTSRLLRKIEEDDY